MQDTEAHLAAAAATAGRAVLGAALLCLGIGAARADDAALAFFETRIRPVLAAHCADCHGLDVQKGGLRVDHGGFLLRGGENGPAVVPGDTDASRLLRAVGYGDVDLQMPPSGKLPDAAIADLRAWIAGGAWWPDEPEPDAARAEVFDLQARRAAHWAWHPPVAPPIPATRGDWGRGPVDRFILAGLEAAGLSPAPPADAATLFRRAHFDLTGLPPSAADARAFAEDTAPDAFDRAVDRMLDSPHFGEHWGRKWLDLTRYAETYGFEQDFAIPEAWRYRDYVVRAFNADVPYDQLLREHIAGDLLEYPRRHPDTGANESILGTGWWGMHQAQHAPVDVRLDRAERVDNQIDVFSKAFLGMTVSCARCHDHKFDAISAADYHALAGIFRSVRQDLAELDPDGGHAAAARRLGGLHARGTRLLADQLPALAPPRAPHDGGVLFADFADGYAEWFPSGPAFGTAPTGAAAWMPHQDGARPVPPGMAHSGTLGGGLRGTLRSATFTITHDRIHFVAAGRRATIRLIVEGYTLRGEVPLLFESTAVEVNHGPEPRWIEMADLGKYRDCQAHIELVDPGAGWLGVDRIVFSDGPPPPSPEAGPGETIHSPRIAPVLRRMAEADARIPPPVRAFAVADGNGLDMPVYIRGNPKTPGAVVPRGFLEAIAGPAQSPVGPGSGRLALADYLLDPANPLTARVMVNRVWHHLFGRGLVASVDNFGATGQPPTHPELLDHLAIRFEAEGWWIKRLIRELVLSETYRMDSAPANHRAEALDPANTLLHRMPLRRLPAEPIRDALLAVAGTLDATVGGVPVPAYLSPFTGGHRRPEVSGPMDGARRRSIYLEVRRNHLPGFLQVFDFPSPDTTHGARNVSNVPAQSLTLLNDPFVVEQAAAWAARLCADGALPPERRVDALYWEALGRAPRAEERAAALAFVRARAAADPRGEAGAWADLCHVVFTLKEFIFIA